VPAIQRLDRPCYNRCAASQGGQRGEPNKARKHITHMSDASLKKKPRPLWYNLSPLNLPLPGLVSILHRLSGALMFLALLWLLYLFDASLASPERFETIRSVLAQPLGKLILLLLLWAYLHHAFAGVRYLFLDIDKGLALPVARLTSVAVLVASLALTALVGWRLLW
jgi:succinate dehydrogenase / fumarate reductase cytochrome b subunit